MSIEHPTSPPPPAPPPPAKPPKRQKPKSRSARWSDAAGTANGILEQIASLLDEFETAAGELRSVQEEYEEWKDNLPENLQSSPLGEKLEEVCNLEIEDAGQKLRDAIEEVADTFSTANEIDLPQGFGRD